MADKKEKSSERTHIVFPRNATPEQMLRAIQEMAHELRPDVNPPVEKENEDASETEKDDGEEED